MSTAVARGADPRPCVGPDGVLAGARCTRCGHALARATPRCPRCRGATEAATFGPEGTIWAHTVVHVASGPEQEVPYALGYLDLDDGPRLLVHLDAGSGASVGARARLTGVTGAGNPAAEVTA